MLIIFPIFNGDGKMKVIFLDIDGVFNSQQFYRERPVCIGRNKIKEFDPNCVNHFNRVIKETSAEIVVSSTWRKGDINYLKTLFKQVGIIGNVIGETKRIRSSKLTIPRGCEIAEYYRNTFDFLHYSWKENESILESYVIIDDDSDMLYEQRNNFVQTSNKVGLTYEDSDLAIKILNQGN